MPLRFLAPAASRGEPSAAHRPGGKAAPRAGPLGDVPGWDAVNARGRRWPDASPPATIRSNGGVALSNGKRTVSLRRPTIVSTKRGVSIYALVRSRAQRICHGFLHHLHARCVTSSRWHVARIASVTGVSIKGATATGTVKITRATAELVNRLAGKHVVSAGAVLGTATLSPTFA